jgi:phospho-N-acetylmuramoyl-pentapeptide-transferase
MIVVATLYLSDDVVVREKIRNSDGEFKREIVDDSLEGKQRSPFWTREIKSTKTTLPFIQNHEFDYAWIVAF